MRLVMEHEGIVTPFTFFDGVFAVIVLGCVVMFLLSCGVSIGRQAEREQPTSAVVK